MSTRYAATFIIFALISLVAFAAPTESPSTGSHEDPIRSRALVWEGYFFQHQSGNIKFTEWIELFTLCLAPLVAHLIAGVPEPSTYNRDMESSQI